MEDILTAVLPQGLSVLAYQAQLKFTSPGCLGDEAPASAIRGGIGRGLKRLAFCREEPGCECPFCRVFEPAAPPGAAGSLSPGYVLETPYFPPNLQEGDLLYVNVLFLGTAASALPWFVAALAHAGQVGIGQPKARFMVDRSEEPRRFTHDDIRAALPDLEGSERCDIVLGSPLMLTDTGSRKPVTELSFPRLVKAIFERLQPAVGYWCGGMMRNTERASIAAPLLDLAGGLEWRFAPGEVVRQATVGYGGKRTSLEGITGRLSVEGDLGPFWPLLVAGGLVHVGQRPHLDRGRYVLSLEVED